MERLNLVLTIPHGSVIATNLGIDGLAHHLSPGSGRHFHGRGIFVDLALDGGKAAFSYLDEGGWRDTSADTAAVRTAHGAAVSAGNALPANPSSKR